MVVQLAKNCYIFATSRMNRKAPTYVPASSAPRIREATLLIKDRLSD